MNLVIVEDRDFDSPHTVRITGRRWRHISQVHQARPGRLLRVGRLGGLCGAGEVVEIGDGWARLEVELHDPPPPPLALTLIIALTRPKMMRRIFTCIAEIGIKDAYVINSWRVEKSYWQSPQLGHDAVREQLIQGLEQARDTTLPRVQFRRRFKPFVEDELPGLIAGNRALLAHPDGAATAARAASVPTVLAVGPEGGFIPYEIESLQRIGFETVTLGPRIYRVESALITAASRLCIN